MVVRFSLSILACTMTLLCSCSAGSPAGSNTLPLETISLPPGFSISIFSDKVPGARSLARSPGGILYVSTRGEGEVYALPDANGDNVADTVFVIASGFEMPNGVAWRNGSLYVAEVHSVWRFDGIDTRLENPPRPVLVSDEFPRDRHHGWKFIRFGPDGKLYVPVGAPCNVCEEENEQYATIMRMNPDGSALEVYAHGVRNTVGFDWHPESRELWFTDNGRDWMGDDSPPDELNRAERSGMHFGFPFCHGGDIDDPEHCAEGGCCAGYTAPAWKLGAHVAALGMRFYTAEQFPDTYRNSIFIAEHGSWNRSVPDGYRVGVATLDGNTVTGYKPFAEGWLQDGKAWGRPVDVLVMPDGALLVSDDRAGVVYRIAYQ